MDLDELAKKYGGQSVAGALRLDELARKYGGSAIEPEVKEEPSGFLRQAADIPLSIGRGALTGVRMVADAFGAGSRASEAIKGAEGYVAGLMSAQARNDEQEIARIMKDAEDKGVLDQVQAAFKAFSVAPVDLLTQGLGTAGVGILGMLGGKVLGASTLGLRAIGAATGAGMGAGAAKGSIYEEVKSALIEAGENPQKAEQVAQQAQAYGGKNLDQILLGTTLGAVSGGVGLEGVASRILSRAATKEAAGQAAKGAIREAGEGALKTAAVEGLPEYLQGSQEQLAKNIALQREGFDVPTMRGVVGSGVLEGLAGAGLGAIAGGTEAGLRRQARDQAQRIFAEEEKQRIAQEAQAEQQRIAAERAAEEERMRPIREAEQREREAAETRTPYYTRLKKLQLELQQEKTPEAKEELAFVNSEIARLNREQIERRRSAAEAQKRSMFAEAELPPVEPRALMELQAEEAAPEPTGMEAQAAGEMAAESQKMVGFPEESGLVAKQAEMQKQLKSLQAERNKIKVGGNLYKVLEGQLDPGEVSDISSDIKKLYGKGYRPLANPAGQGTFISELVENKILDDFLPPNMRPESSTFDVQQSTEYIKDKLRNKETGAYVSDEQRQNIDRQISELQTQLKGLGGPEAEVTAANLEAQQAKTEGLIAKAVPEIQALRQQAQDQGIDLSGIEEQAFEEARDNPDLNPDTILAERLSDALGMPRYQRETTTGEYIGKEQTQSIVDAVKSQWKNAPEVVVAENMDDPAIPAEVREHNRAAMQRGAKGSPRGFFYKGKAYVLADAATSPTQVIETLFHEALGHYGLRGTFGPEMESVLKDVVKYRRAEVEAKAKQYGLDPKSEKDLLEAAEEVLAEIAQTKPGLSFVKRAIAVIRNFLRDLGLPFKMSNEDIIQKYILPARAFVEKGGSKAVEGKPAAMLSFDNESGNFNPDLDKYWINQGKKEINGEGMSDSEYNTAVAEYANAWRIDEILEKMGWRRRGSSNVSASTYYQKDIELDEPNADGEDTLTYEVRVSDHGDRHPADGTIKRRFQINFRTETAQWSDVDVTPDMTTADAIAALEGALSTDFATPDSGGAIFGRSEGKPAAMREEVRYQREAEPEPKQTRLNIAGEPVLGSWNIQVDPKLELQDGLIYKFLDKNIDVKRIVESIEKLNGEIAQRWNPYLQEELYHGRTAAATQEFADDEWQPLLKEMDKLDVTIGELEQYLHNRHAEDYNKLVAERNPTKPEMQDGGSGVKTADARKYFEDLSPEKRKKYEALAKRIDDITKGTRELLVKNGYETPERIEAWEKAFPNYVPLMREEGDFDYNFGSFGTGRGFDVRRDFSRSAMGSKRQVVDIIGNIIAARNNAIMLTEKNRVAQAVYGLAVQNPNPDFWLAVNPDAEKQPADVVEELNRMGIDEEDFKNLAKEPRQRSLDPKTNKVISRVNDALRKNDYVLATRINGERRYVFFNPKDERSKRAVTALKNLDAENLGMALGTIAKVTRWMAAVNTQYNPIFGIYNFLRDTQAAALQLSTTPLAGKQLEVGREIPSSLRAIYGSLRKRHKGEKVDTEMAQLWKEFQKEGGQTGFKDVFSRTQDRQEALVKEMMRIKEGKTMKAGRVIVDWLSDYNDTLENAVRLSAYKVAKKKFIDEGKTETDAKQLAASLAKNLTVNFNRKGDAALQAGALYAFFNASMQGTARAYQTITGPMGKKILAGGLLWGVMQASIYALAGFDEDEPPEFVRERNIVIPTGDGDYLAFPMPLGYHVIPGFSRIISEWALSGFKDTPDRIASLTGMFLEAFNPIGNAGWSVQTIAPTFADPIVALAENKDWTGKPIAKKDLFSLDPTPGYTRARDGANVLTSGIAKFLNFSTGGTRAEPGLLSPTPEQIEYLIGQAAGGIGRELTKGVTSIEKAVTGEELPPYKIPLYGRFVGETKSSAAESNRFYKNMEKLNILDREIKVRRENQEPIGDFMRENPEARLAPMARKTYKDIQELRKRREKLVERDAPRESVKAVEEQIKRRMAMFNDRVAQLKD